VPDFHGRHESAHRKRLFYPDVVVACDPADAHEFYIERPALVAEVLSPSTEARDSLDKRIAY
jgi:Uma2 family endonuclease